jgi:hypothetical protein
MLVFKDLSSRNLPEYATDEVPITNLFAIEPPIAPVTARSV